MVQASGVSGQCWGRKEEWEVQVAVYISCGGVLSQLPRAVEPSLKDEQSVLQLMTMKILTNKVL